MYKAGTIGVFAVRRENWAYDRASGMCGGINSRILINYMDKDRNYIPPSGDKNRSGSGYGRRVRKDAPDSGYDMDRAREELNKKRSSEKKKREAQRRKQSEHRRAMRIRAALTAAALALLVFIVLFLTPLLNIKNVAVSGNVIVTAEELAERLEKAKGENLIMFSNAKAEEILSDLSYVESVSVSKFLIPPSIRVNITECKPAASMELNGRSVIIDPQLKVLSDSNEFDNDGLPVIEGFPVSKYRVGKELTPADNDEGRTEILRTCLDVMSRLDMIGKIDYIDLSDTGSIRFGYDNRIDALCGSDLELERKIRMFNVTVTGTSLSENAHGTIDLTSSGKAVYVP
ncbi:MAG: FtsQ-type POTRA domain-containing protein [bacterium]|nr:FtsQ-type POTRA domain-containing protein [bacterium]